MKSFILALATAMSLLLPPKPAMALIHVVQSGDTLAALAERYYGRIQFERILVAANRLDVGGGTALIPGMHLVVPTVTYVTVPPKETWSGLAQRYLGAAQRSDVLSMANGSSPWLAPDEGTRVLVPYNLTVQLSSDETVVSVAQKYLGDGKHAWMLTHYNNLKKGQLERGTVILIPLTNLELSNKSPVAVPDPERLALDAAQSERKLQRKIASEIPALIADVRSGRYVDAIARGNRFLASNVLTLTQHTLVLRLLVESYVALEAMGAATAACSDWRKLDPALRLDPTDISPKILKVCGASPP
jgi:phage tail protein X